MTLAQIVALEPRICRRATWTRTSWRRVGPRSRNDARGAGRRRPGVARRRPSVLARKAANVIETTSPRTGSTRAGSETYYTTGRTTIRRVRLAMLQTRKTEVRQDPRLRVGLRAHPAPVQGGVPGGPPRRLRHPARGGRLLCGDLRRRAGLRRRRSGRDDARREVRPDLARLALHASRRRAAWKSLLDLLERALEPDGLLLFTTQGRFIRDQIAERTWQDAYGQPIWVNWGVSEEQLDEVVSDYDRDGFGYLEWGALDRQYGTSIATPAWVLGAAPGKARLRDPRPTGSAAGSRRTSSSASERAAEPKRSFPEFRGSRADAPARSVATGLEAEPPGTKATQPLSVPLFNQRRPSVSEAPGLDRAL